MRHREGPLRICGCKQWVRVVRQRGDQLQRDLSTLDRVAFRVQNGSAEDDFALGSSSLVARRDQMVRGSFHGGPDDQRSECQCRNDLHSHSSRSSANA